MTAKRTSKSSEPYGVSATALAAHLCFSRAYIDKLTASGVLPRGKDGRFDLDKCRAAYIAHLRQARRTSATSNARARLDLAKAREVEVKNAQREGKLIEIADALFAVDEVMALLRTFLTGLPARASRDLRVRAEIERACNHLLRDLSDKLETCIIAQELANERERREHVKENAELAP